MKLTVNREPTNGKVTVGELSIDGKFVCYTLEDAIREVAGRPVAEWKVKGQTAIPAGTYQITEEESPRFGPKTLTVNGVPGFSLIRIHSGNSEADTEGCLIVGAKLTPNRQRVFGGSSRPALAVLKGIVSKALSVGEKVTIEYINPEAA